MKTFRGLLAAITVVGALAVAPLAQAAPSPASVFDGEVPCSEEASIIVCSGHTKSFDNTRIDVNFFLPAAGAAGGPYPTIGVFHGWGGAKQGLTTVGAPTGEVAPEPTGYLVQEANGHIKPWAESGYAVFSMSDRGWGQSCGRWDKPAVTEAAKCEHGYNHLMDDRYEVRDAQYLMGILAEEGFVEPKKIGVTGVSYGGGLSMALAALRNREMEPSGALVTWENADNEELEIAAAVPQWPWTDISYALAPNGRNLDYVTESSYRGPEGKFPIGVMKYSWVEGLNKVGTEFSNYTGSEIPSWLLRLKAGEPYTDSSIQGIITLLSTFHSSYGIEPSEAPAPLLIQSGWNDDLFPVDEALRYYQRTRAKFPGDPISLYLTDVGHARSQNKAADVAAFNVRLEEWFAHYLKGEGSAPTSSVEAKTTTCPGTEPSGGPYKASDWSGLVPGEVNYKSGPTQTIVPYANPQEITAAAASFDPLVNATGLGACAQIPSTDQSGVANYRTAAAPAGGFTLMGSPTITATIEAPSPNSEIAARLVDVSPSGTESLVARGLYRPGPNGGTQQMLFQLHPQGYHFAEGHVAKLELLPSDFPYGRFSNFQTAITVSNLEMRLPVMEQPGTLGGLVQTPAAKVVPAGYTLAAEYEQKETGGGGGGGGGGSTTPPPAPTAKPGVGGLAGKLSANGKYLFVPLSCSNDGACSGHVSVSTKKAGAKNRTTLGQGNYSIAKGADLKLRLKLTKGGSKLVAASTAKKLGGVFMLTDSGRAAGVKLNRPVVLSKGGN